MAGDPMIGATLACIQKIENGGEDAGRMVALVLVIAHPEGEDDPDYHLIPAASLTITVPGATADHFEVGKLYELNLTEAAGQ